MPTEASVKALTLTSAVSADGSAVLIETESYHRAHKLLEAGRGLAILGARQVGKTTLMNWLRPRLENQGDRVVYANIGLSQPKGFQGIVNFLVERIMIETGISTKGLRKKPDAHLRGALERSLHPDVGVRRSLVLMIDEADSILEGPAHEAVEFLMLMRALSDHFKGRLKTITTSLFPLDQLFRGANVAGNVVANLLQIRLSHWKTNDPNVIQGLIQAFNRRWRDVELEHVLEDMLKCTSGHPGLMNHLCWDLANMDPTRSPVERWRGMRLLVLSPPMESDPLETYINGLKPQLLSLGSRFFAVHPVMLKLIRGQPFLSEDTDLVKSLAEIGIVDTVSDDVPKWAAPCFECRLTESWASALYQTALSEINTFQSRSTPVSLVRGQKRRVLLLTMGGTIGMAESPSGQKSFRNTDQVLAAMGASDLAHLAQIDLQPYVRLNGIEVRQEHWIGLAELLNGARESYDAFVVTHGTDTLAYTASAVAYMLGPRFAKPVIFTGAQTTMDVIWGDARVNLTRAVLAGVAKQAIPEVQIVFGDLVLRAVRAVKEDDRLFQAFTSPATVPLARITEGFLRLEGWVPLGDRYKEYKFLPYAAEDILFISISPGVSPDLWLEALSNEGSKASKTRGIILSTPGAGSLPITQEGYSFMPLIQWAVDHDVPVLVISQMPINAYALQQYEVANVGIQIGAIPAGNMTLASAYTKFSWAIGRVDSEKKLGSRVGSRTAAVRDIMLLPYVGEQVDETDINPLPSETVIVH